MNKLLFFSIVALLFMGCAGQPVIVSEKYETPTDSLYIKCADLKGLGNLHIGKTLFKDLSKDECITQYSLKSSFIGGFWGEIYKDELRKYYEANKKIKQVRIGEHYHPYKVGALEFTGLDAAFLNDTLVAISLGGNFHLIESLLEDKYGCGQGSYEYYWKSKGENGKSNFFREHHEHKLRIWANENVKLEKKYDYDLLVKRNKDIYNISGDEYCLITSQTRYDDFLQVIEDCKKEYDSHNEALRKESYEKL